MARVDWTADARTVSRIIRAYDPRPGAFAMATSGEVKLFGARVSSGATAGQPGEVVAIDASGMTVACGEGGAVQIASVQPAGKRRLSPQDWARGRGIGLGERLF
jgi:methionyl-tRNA formyltransferase